jgi:hypothetical protein
MAASARMRAAWSAAMALFEKYAYFVFFYALVAPALPWLLARRRATSAIWGATAAALLLLFFFSALLWPACVAVNCGQGGILVVVLWGFAALSAMTTMLVAGTLAYLRK